MIPLTRLAEMAVAAGAQAMTDPDRPRAAAPVVLDTRALARFSAMLRAATLDEAARLALDMLIKGGCTRLEVSDAIRNLAKGRKAPAPQRTE